MNQASLAAVAAVRYCEFCSPPPLGCFLLKSLRYIWPTAILRSCWADPQQTVNWEIPPKKVDKKTKRDIKTAPSGDDDTAHTAGRTADSGADSGSGSGADDEISIADLAERLRHSSDPATP